MVRSFRKWSEHPYPGETTPPKNYPDLNKWPLFYILRAGNDLFLDPFHQPIRWRIKDPNNIDWVKELLIVEQTLASLTPKQIQNAKYWGTGNIISKMVVLINDFAKKDNMGFLLVAKIQAIFFAAVNDSSVISWYFKFHWDCARPAQYDRNLPTVIKTPLFPSYPSTHATVAGCAEVILNYFFPQESSRIRKMMEECALSRLYAGVHFKVDIEEGYHLGRQIGEILKKNKIFTGVLD